ncbi:hypothetical protein CCACVL1_22125 [Corchorus capsularis]|uniref:Uncharacterized protein n=1 Tax=Corchorus capsularis TaxID=210143 RepID=A0A1R3H0X6_COCAP|nr:hypothetical protein CCACVL1_22125 [Corchorus capsularis]
MALKLIIDLHSHLLVAGHA